MQIQGKNYILTDEKDKEISNNVNSSISSYDSVG